MRKIFLVWLVVSLPVFISAQQNLTDVSKLHPLSIRLNALGLIDAFDGNLSGGIEYGIGRRGALTADLGWIFYSAYVNNASGVLGFHFKPAYRYYFTDSRRGFLDAGLFFKRIGYRMSDWLEKGIVNGVSSYQEFQTFTYRKNAVGVQLIGGYKVPLEKKDVLWLEFYSGLSARVKWRDIKGMPDAAYRRVGGIFESDAFARSFWPGIPGGMRLVFRVD